MKPIRFPEAYERALQPGGNPNCGELPFVLALDPNTPGPVVLISCWEPSEHELAAIMDEKKIYIGVCAHPEKPTQPPFYAIGINPFTGFGKESFVKLSRQYDPSQIPQKQERTFDRELFKKILTQMCDGLCDIGEANIVGFPAAQLREYVGDYVLETDKLLFEPTWNNSKLVPDDSKEDTGVVGNGTVVVSKEKQPSACELKPQEPTQAQDLPNLTDHLFNQRNQTE